MPPARDRPMASSSSMKMMAGWSLRACSKRSRTREAPTPTIASTNSDAAAEKKGTSASPATARASSVLPVPGGPESSTPRGPRPPGRGEQRRELVGVRERRDLGLEAIGGDGPAVARRVVADLAPEVAVELLALRGDLLDVVLGDLVEEVRAVGHRDLRVLLGAERAGHEV